MRKIQYYIVCVCVCALALCACASEDSTLDMKGMFSPNGEVVGTRFAQSMAYNDSVGKRTSFLFFDNL